MEENENVEVNQTTSGNGGILKEKKGLIIGVIAAAAAIVIGVLILCICLAVGKDSEKIMNHYLSLNKNIEKFNFNDFAKILNGMTCAELEAIISPLPLSTCAVPFLTRKTSLSSLPSSIGSSFPE